MSVLAAQVEQMGIPSCQTGVKAVFTTAQRLRALRWLKAVAAVQALGMLPHQGLSTSAVQVGVLVMHLLRQLLRNLFCVSQVVKRLVRQATVQVVVLVRQATAPTEHQLLVVLAAQVVRQHLQAHRSLMGRVGRAVVTLLVLLALLSVAALVVARMAPQVTALLVMLAQFM